MLRMIPSAARLLTPLADRGLLEDPPPPRARLCGRLRLRGCLGIRSDPGGRLGQFWGLWRGARMNGLQGLAQLPRNREIRSSTSENSVKAKVAEFTYQEDKRCMLARLKSSADFSRGLADRGISHLLFATHPTLPCANGGENQLKYLTSSGAALSRLLATLVRTLNGAQPTEQATARSRDLSSIQSFASSRLCAAPQHVGFSRRHGSGLSSLPQGRLGYVTQDPGFGLSENSTSRV